MTSTVSQLGAQHERDIVETIQASSFVVWMRKKDSSTFKGKKDDRAEQLSSCFLASVANNQQTQCDVIRTHK